MLQAIKEFQLQRLADFEKLGAGLAEAWRVKSLPQVLAVGQNLPESAQYTAAGSIILAHLVLVLLTRSGRRVIFTTVDTVLAVVLLSILLVAILSLPVGAVYIGIRGSILMARSLSDNFPTLGLVLRPILAVIGQAAATGAGATTAAGTGAGAAAAAAAR